VSSKRFASVGPSVCVCPLSFGGRLGGEGPVLDDQTVLKPENVKENVPPDRCPFA
jgi:hypothetical protein